MKRQGVVLMLLWVVLVLSSCASNRKGHGHRKTKGKGKGCDCPTFGQAAASEMHTSFRV